MSIKGNNLHLSSTRLKDGRKVYLIYCSATNFTYHSLVIYDAEKSETLFEKKLEERVEIDGVCNGRALIRNKDRVDFFCFDTLKVVESFNFKDIADETNEDEEKSKNSEDFVVKSKFDCNATRKQFVIFCKNLSFFQLMSYSNEEGFTVPTILYRGSTFIYDLHSAASLRQAVLMNGLLFVAPATDVQPTYDDPMNDIYWPDPRSATFMALDLKSARGCSGMPFFTSPISIMGSEHSDHHYLRPILNGLVSRFRLHDSKLSMAFSSDEKLIVDAGKKKILSFDFSKTSREVAEIEATRFFDEEEVELARIAAIEGEKKRLKDIREREIQEKQEQQEKVLNEKRERMEKLKEKYADRQITGTIETWKTGFGFLKGSGEAAEIGSVFVHISAFVNKSEIYIRRGMPVFFRVVYDPERGNYRACWAEGLDDNVKPGGRGRGRGRGRGGRRGHKRGGLRGGILF